MQDENLAPERLFSPPVVKSQKSKQTINAASHKTSQTKAIRQQRKNNQLISTASKPQMISETQLRIALIKHLTSDIDKRETILACEARYGFEDRRADLVIVTEFSHAIEIKSDFDSTNRLKDQLAEYSSTFDYVSVATTSKHLKKVREIAGKKIGILTINESGVAQKRQPKRNILLSKNSLVASITKERLAKKLEIPSSRQQSNRIQEIAVSKLTTSELRSLFIEEIKSRFKAPTSLFFSETDTDINEEDLLLLKRVSNIFS